MTFDLIIINPPYNRNLDLKILKEVYELGERICIVHPLGWLYSQKGISKLFNETKILCKDSLEYIETLRYRKYFNICLFTEFGITYINKQTKNPLDVNGFDRHGTSEIYKTIKQKILNYCETNNNYNKMLVKNKDFNYYFGMIWFDPYTAIVFKKNLLNHISTVKKKPYNFGFDTYYEVLNFYESSKTKMQRFCLSIFKITLSTGWKELSAIPYMPTYEHSWTDEEIAKEIGLTEEEFIWIMNYTLDYYPEDKEKYSKYIK